MCVSEIMYVMMHPSSLQPQWKLGLSWWRGRVLSTVNCEGCQNT